MNGPDDKILNTLLLYIICTRMDGGRGENRKGMVFLGKGYFISPGQK